MYNIKIFLNYNKNALSRVVQWLNLNFKLTKVWYKLGYESINWKFTVFKWIFMTDNTTGTPYLPFKTMSPHINQPKIDFWSSHVTSSYYHVTSSRGFVWLYSIKATMHHFLVNTRVKTACKNWLQTVCCWRLEQMSKLENQNFYFLPKRIFFLAMPKIRLLSQFLNIYRDLKTSIMRRINVDHPWKCFRFLLDRKYSGHVHF